MYSHRPINVFADAHVFDQGYQGTRTCLKEIYKRIAQKADIQLFLGAHDIDTLKEEFGIDNNIQFLSYSSQSRWRRLALEIPVLLRKNNIDLAHFQYIPPLFKSCAYLVTLHDILFEEFPEQFTLSYRFKKNILFSHGVRKADQLITVSNQSYQAIQKKWPSAGKKSRIIHNGVDQRFFSNYDKKEAIEQARQIFGFDGHILFVGRWETRKGHQDLLAAWLKLELYKQNIPLVFAGQRESTLPAFEKLLNSMSPEQKKWVHILENRKDNDLLLLYRSARLFVYPSYAEGFGLPPLEAGAAGIPVICSDRSAMKEFDFFGGGCFDPTIEGRLKDTLSRFIEQPPGNDDLEMIKAKIEQRYSWEKAATAHYELIVSMMKQKK